MNSSIPNHPNQRDRNASIRWARQRLNNRDFVIMDTESTGLLKSSGKKHEVVRICVADPNGKLVFDSLVRPSARKSMPSDATAEHGLKWADVKNAPTIDQLIPNLMNQCVGKIVIAYNYEFDYGLIAQSCEIAEVMPPRFLRSACAMKMWSQFVGEPRPRATYADKYRYQKQPGSAAGQSSEEDIMLTLSCLKKWPTQRHIERFFSDW